MKPMKSEARSLGEENPHLNPMGEVAQTHQVEFSLDPFPFAC